MKVYARTEKKLRIPIGVAKGFCVGEPSKMTFLSPRVQLSQKAFQYLFELLGGITFIWETIH
ncbi:MAG: hypothetical protein ACPHOJ_05775, partial [Litorivicinaceae bacterium]